MAEEEVIEELEALRAVYGEDCTVLSLYPPHFHIYIKPRTADDHSQQFVEASIEIQADTQYPNEPPDIKITTSKGLDEERLKVLDSCLHEKARNLLSCSMLIALCEEAVEKLSNMNHPDGDCPLCLDPLVSEGKQNELLPFMKLMSCFHCFHCQCIIRWWNWLQTQNQPNFEKASQRTAMPSGAHKQDSMGSCPVCRKVFHTEDIKHVMNLSDSFSSKLTIHENEALDDGHLLKSDLEANRREKYERLLELQKQKGGLIELKTNGVLFSNTTFLAEPLPDISSTVAAQATEHDDHPTVSEECGASSSFRPIQVPKLQQRGNSTSKDKDGTSSSSRPIQVPKQQQRGNSTATEQALENSPDRPGPSKRENSEPKKYNRRSSRTHTKHWIQKER